MRKPKTFHRQSLDAFHHAQIPKLVGTLFRGSEALPAGTAPSRIFALTSPQSAEGVTTIARLMARELARHPERDTLLVSTAELARISPDLLQQPDRLWTRDPLHDVWHLAETEPATPAGGSSSWQSDPRFVRDLIAHLRARFGAVVLDCGALLSSPDLPKLGHLVDGAVVVVEAGRSTTSQIEHALQVLQLAGAEFKGFVLNRRTYPIPELIYRWLRS